MLPWSSLGAHWAPPKSHLAARGGLTGALVRAKRPFFLKTHVSSRRERHWHTPDRIYGPWARSGGPAGTALGGPEASPVTPRAQQGPLEPPGTCSESPGAPPKLSLGVFAYHFSTFYIKNDSIPSHISEKMAAFRLTFQKNDSIPSHISEK